MAATSQLTFVEPEYIGFAEAYSESRWYAAYTCANHEKSVARQLAERRIEHFLPLYRSVRRWSDRRVTLELPLFPGYVFVRFPLRDRLRVLQTPSLARLISFGGLPTPLADEEMEILRLGLSESLQARPHPFLTVGRRVRITGGPLAGLSGVLKRQKNLSWVVVSVDLIQRSVMVNVEASDIAPII